MRKYLAVFLENRQTDLTTKFLNYNNEQQNYRLKYTQITEN